MTQPNPSDSGSGDTSTPPASTITRPTVGKLVTFNFHDRWGGRDVSGLGLVVDPGADGEPVTVRPLENNTLAVELEDLATAKSSDLTGA